MSGRLGSNAWPSCSHILLFRLRRADLRLADWRRSSCGTSTTKPSTSPAADVSVFTAKINLGAVFAGQAVGIKEVDDGIWLVTFMDYDLGYIDLEEKTLQHLNNPFGPKVGSGVGDGI
jgi:hypothetical protein